jgi:hypothetical protein
VRRLASEPRREQGQRDRPGVGQHVRGIREQRQGVGKDARHDLGGHQAEDQREGEYETPGVVRPDVCVAVVVHGQFVVSIGAQGAANVT